MRESGLLAAASIVAALVVLGHGSAGAQAPSATDCEALRARLGEHAALSDGVRKLIAAIPAPPRSGARAAAGRIGPAAGRADALRARLQQIPEQRQQLEEQRLGALVRLDIGRASAIQGELEALVREQETIEKELAGLPSTAAPMDTPAAVSPGSVDHVACKDMAATYETALRTRRKELGARESNGAVIPLLRLRVDGGEPVATRLARQFAPWPEAALQLGLLDRDGDGKLDALVDVPARDTYRLYRERPDGSLVIEVFALPGRGGEYPNVARRLDEAVARAAGWRLMDVLATAPAGPARLLSETASFAKASSLFAGGSYVDAGQVDAARMRTFENFRGEALRVLEVIAPAPGGGVTARRVVITQRSDQPDQWEETVVVTRATSSGRADVEISGSRESRTTAGVLVGTRTLFAPTRVTLER